MGASAVQNVVPEIATVGSDGLETRRCNGTQSAFADCALSPGAIPVVPTLLDTSPALDPRSPLGSRVNPALENRGVS